MEPRTHGYVVGLAGFLYGTVGYGLSVFSYIFGAALRQFFPEPTIHLAPPTPILSRARRDQCSTKLKPRLIRNSSKQPPSPGLPDPNSERVTHEKISLQRSPSKRLPRVSSLDSFRRTQSLVPPPPIITVNHPDGVDNFRGQFPIATIHPNFPMADKNNHESTSLPVQPPPSLPPLPTTEPIRPGTTSRFSSLRPLFGGEKARVYRSASSPQLTELSKAKVSRKSIAKVQPIPTPTKSCNRKTWRQVNRDPAISAPSKSFTSSKKSVERKRSQSRTRPYDAPYFVPPPVPPIPLDVVRAQEAGRNKTKHPTE